MLHRLFYKRRAGGDAGSSGFVIVPGWKCLRTGELSSISWINPNGGDWDTASNWSGDSVPTASDDATISIAVTNPITHSASNCDFGS